jgi:UDP-glucose 4-epimerase
MHRRPILDKLKALTGFRPKWSLDDTIRDLIENEERRRLQVAA